MFIDSAHLERSKHIFSDLFVTNYVVVQVSDYKTVKLILEIVVSQ